MDLDEHGDDDYMDKNPSCRQYRKTRPNTAKEGFKQKHLNVLNVPQLEQQTSTANKDMSIKWTRHALKEEQPRQHQARNYNSNGCRNQFPQRPSPSSSTTRAKTKTGHLRPPLSINRTVATGIRHGSNGDSNGKRNDTTLWITN